MPGRSREPGSRGTQGSALTADIRSLRSLRTAMCSVPLVKSVQKRWTMRHSSLLAAARITASTAAAILLGVWINLLTSEPISQRSLLRALRQVGPYNLLLVGAVGSLVAAEIVARRMQSRNNKEFADRYRLLQQRQRRMLEASLGVTCELISRTIGIPCNARYFRCVAGRDGRLYLEQDRDLAILNITMPREFGFSRVAVDTPHFISGRSFRDRMPIYEELPVDHSKLYSKTVTKMIEPSQRWVLACPVLDLDSATNRHNYDANPHGVIVFYGVDLPKYAADSDTINTAIRQAEQFADNMSHVINMLALIETPAEIS